MIILVVAHPGVMSHDHPGCCSPWSPRTSPGDVDILPKIVEFRESFLTIVEIHTGSVELFSLHQVAVAISFRWYKGPISKHLLVNLLLLCTKKLFQTARR
jgi:hypothetical protein